MVTTLVFLGIGLGAGVLAGIFGIGGGLVIVPALVFFAKMEIKTATGTSLGALMLPASALGAWTYWRQGNVDVKGSLLLAAGLLVGGFVGARLATHIDSVIVQRAFSILLVAIAVRMWFGK